MRVPDPRPSRADAEARAKRKTFEKENPHFNMGEFGMKAGAIALLTAVALFPWEKEYDKHERTHHPERFQDERDAKDRRDNKGGGRDGDREGRREARDGDRRRRQSEGGERQREYKQYLDRDREYRALEEVDKPLENVGRGRGVEGRGYTGSDDGEYGRRYIEASKREKERMGRGSESGRRRRGSVDYESRRSKGDRRR